MLRASRFHCRTHMAAAFAFVFFLILLVESAPPLGTCSRTCITENCNSFGIRYGKFCGVGYSGCPGEQPCDDLDACCQIHDDCVGKKGVTNVQCHEKFKNCIRRVQNSGKVGYSWTCPYDRAVPTMRKGMDVAILFSHFGSKFEF